MNKALISMNETSLITSDDVIKEPVEKSENKSESELIDKKEVEGENEIKEEIKSEIKTRKRIKKVKNENHISKGLKIEIYPTPAQIKNLEILMGGSRWVWNWGLDLQEKYYELHQKKMSEQELSHQFTLLKKEAVERHKKGEESPQLWLNSMPRTSITLVFDHLKQAWDAYFNSLSGKRLGPKMNRPTFKAKHFSKKSVSFQVDTRHKNPLSHAGFEKTDILAKPKSNKNSNSKSSSSKQNKTKTKVQNKKLKNKALTPKTTIKAYLKVPVIGLVPASFDSNVQPFAEHISTLTLSQKGSRWFASLTCVDVDKTKWMKSKKMPEITPEFKQNPYGVFALDAAISHRGTGFNGKEFVKLARLDKNTSKTNSSKSLETIQLEKLAQEKLLRSELRKRRYQRSFARQMEMRKKEQGLDPKKPIPKGTKLETSNRQKKNKDHMARISDHQANQRRDQAHKFTSNIVRDHHTVVVEGLNLNAMKKGLNKAFRRAYNLATPGQIINMLQYKCDWYGREFIKLDPYFASSKICSNCKVKNKDLKLSDTTWVCPSCGVNHDRDENAAINLWLEGLRKAGLTLPCDFDVEHIKTLARSSPTLRSRESYGHEGCAPDLVNNTDSKKHPVKCRSSSHSKSLTLSACKKQKKA